MEGADPADRLCDRRDVRPSQARQGISQLDDQSTESDPIIGGQISRPFQIRPVRSLPSVAKTLPLAECAAQRTAPRWAANERTRRPLSVSLTATPCSSVVVSTEKSPINSRSVALSRVQKGTTRFDAKCRQSFASSERYLRGQLQLPTSPLDLPARRDRRR